MVGAMLGERLYRCAMARMAYCVVLRFAVISGLYLKPSANASKFPARSVHCPHRTGSISLCGISIHMEIMCPLILRILGKVFMRLLPLAGGQRCL